MNRDPLAHRLRDLAAARFDRMALAWIVCGSIAWVAIAHVAAEGRAFIAAHAPTNLRHGAPIGEPLRSAMTARTERNLLDHLTSKWPPAHVLAFDVAHLHAWLDDAPPAVDVVEIAGTVVPVDAFAACLRALAPTGPAFAQRACLTWLPQSVSPAHAHLVVRGAGWILVLEEVPRPVDDVLTFRLDAHVAACALCGRSIAEGPTRATVAAEALAQGAVVHASEHLYACSTCARLVHAALVEEVSP